MRWERAAGQSNNPGSPLPSTHGFLPCLSLGLEVAMDTAKKLTCLRCHDPLDHEERIFCLHCQFVIDEELKDSEGCSVCGDDRPNNADGTCPGCGSV